MTNKLTSIVYVRYGDLNHHFVLFGNSAALKSWAALGTWAPRTVFSVLDVSKSFVYIIWLSWLDSSQVWGDILWMDE